MINIYREVKETVIETVNNWIEDNIPLHGAALAFSTIFSLAPLLILIVAISGFIFSREASASQLSFYLRDTLGPDITKSLMQLLKNVHQRSGGIIPTLIGIGILLFGATTVITQLKNSLNKVWNVAPKPGQTVKAYVFNRLLALLTILILALLLTLSLLVEAVLSFLQPTLNTILPLGVHFWNTLNEIISKAITFLLFVSIFKLLPDVKIRWRVVFIGALVTTLLFELGTYIIGIYLSMGHLTTTYGAAGSFVVFLVWVYYNSLIVYLGAEFTHVYMQRYEPSFEIHEHVRLTNHPDEEADIDQDALS
ncbi:MAG TPA: YihY/virulence factor BrkB family protein [Balneolales bacterium]|nr:YihY/virulence factor BrkB family protein [Balneolales bacterium]